MPSPFPGMDPWLEAPGVFPDLHATLITYLGDELNAVLPEPYFARTATRVWIDDERTRDPDIGTYDPRPATSSIPTGWHATLIESGMVALAVESTDDPITERFVEIRSTRDDRLVTAIEILSPSNKQSGSSGRAAFREKQLECALGRANLVEIDLLRGGRHTTFVARSALATAFPYATYHVCVTMTGTPRVCYAIGIDLGQELPTIRIPLDADVAPPPINLQTLLSTAYDRRRYGRQVKYDLAPDPPLSPDQAIWAAEILKTKR